MSIQPNYPDFDPAVAAANTNNAYQPNAGNIPLPPAGGTGNPDPVYDPEFAAAAENIAYQTNPNGAVSTPGFSPVLPLRTLVTLTRLRVQFTIRLLLQHLVIQTQSMDLVMLGLLVGMLTKRLELLTTTQQQ